MYAIRSYYEPFPVRFGSIDVLRIFDGNVARVERVGEEHPELFFSQTALQHGPVSRFVSRFVHVKPVGVDRPLPDVLPETVSAGDIDDVAEPRLGIDAELV